MLYEFIVRVPAHTVTLPGSEQTAQVLATPQCVWYQELGAEYDGHKLIQARFAELPECTENYWASVDDLLEENIDLAHLHEVFQAPASAFVRPLEQVKEERIAALRLQVKQSIESRWPQHKQLQMLLGLGSEDELERCRDFIRKIVLAGNTAEEQVRQAQTVSAAYRARCVVTPDDPV